jgi:hypothetical protein
MPALALTGMLGLSPAAGASAIPTINATTTTRTCVTTTQAGCSTPVATIPVNAQLQVICSRGNDYYVEDLAHRAYEGFVSKASVRSAPGGLVDCDTTAHPAIFAAANGLGDYGQTKYDGACLTWVIEKWAGAGTSLPGAGTAAEWWQQFEGNKSGLAGRGYAWDTGGSRFTTPPRGALVFWWGSPRYPQYESQDGHVAISIGNGLVVSTEAGAQRGVHIASIASITQAAGGSGSGPGSGNEAGWVMPIKGYQIQP